VFSCSVRHRDLPSFPTRRSSDLARVAVGNIGGLPWGNETLPPDVYGFWGNETGVYLQGYPKIVGYAYATSPSFISSPSGPAGSRSEEHTSELQSRENLVCRLLLE